MSGTQGRVLSPKVQDPKNTTNDQPKDIVCKHYIKGACFHGFSGSKPHGDKQKCSFAHPKVCHKLFKFGLDKERGCSGKSSGCNDFHPKLCKDHIKGECTGGECRQGFHLRSILKIHKKKSDESKPKEDSDKIVGEESSPKQSVSEDKKGSEKDSFLESMMRSLKELQDQLKEQQKLQLEQQKVLTNLVEDQRQMKDLTPPPWLLNWRR